MLQEILKQLPQTNKNVISVLSGGLDSTILTYLLTKKYSNEQIIALTFNYKQKHNIELEKAKITTKKLNIKHIIVDISFLGDIIKNVSSLTQNSSIKTPNIKDILGDPQPVTYVPYRNLILFSIALSTAESFDAEFVYNGLQTHDEYSYWDTTETFIEKLNEVSKLNRKNNIQLISPFINFSKKDEILIGKELNVPFEDTWTCYNGDKIACGECPSCSERIQNFIKAKIKDPIPYKKEINWNYYLKREK